MRAMLVNHRLNSLLTDFLTAELGLRFVWGKKCCLVLCFERFVIGGRRAFLLAYVLCMEICGLWL